MNSTMGLSRESITTFLFLLPLYVFLAIMIGVPVISVFAGSFGIPVFIRLSPEMKPTLEGYLEFIDPSKPYLESLFFTIKISAISTAIGVLAGYFFALYLTIRNPPTWRKVSPVMTIPLFTPYVVGAFMWWTLLFPRGYIAIVINGILMSLGIIKEPLRLVNDPQGIGIIFGEVWIRFVVATSIMYSSFQMVRRDLVDAARNLGASTWHIIRYVYFPLTRYALIATIATVFLATMIGFSIPFILGGSWPQFLNVMIYLDIVKRFDYISGYVSGAFYLIVSILLGYLIFKFMGKKVVVQAR